MRKMPYKKWSEVLEIRSGRNQTDVLDENGSYPIYGSGGNIMGYANNYICDENTTIIGRKGSINNPLLIKEKFWNVDTAFGLHALEGLDKFYLNYFCQSFDFTELDKGSGRPSLVKSDLLKIEMPIPPLQEQHQIVSILDEAFAAIEQAKANIEKNISNAKELFQSKLNAIFSQRGEGWDNKSLGDVCKIIGGGTPSKANSQFYSGNIPWATVRDMKDEILSTTELCITEEAIKKSSTNVIPKDNVVIATRVGLGKVCILTTDTAINQDLRGVIPIDTSKLSVPYLFQWFKSKSQEIINAGTGATVQGVKLPFVKSLEINIPPLTEQKIIVKQLDELNIQSKKLEELYVSKLLGLEELKKSILQRAFAGELTNKSVTI